MKKETKEYSPIQRWLIYASPILALALVCAIITYVDYTERANRLAALDNVNDSVIISSINKNLSDETKISSLSQVSAIFVNMDEVTVKRTAQMENGDGARVIAKVYERAVKTGNFVTDNDIRAKKKVGITTHETMYANLCVMAEEIGTAESLIPAMD